MSPDYNDDKYDDTQNSHDELRVQWCYCLLGILDGYIKERSTSSTLSDDDIKQAYHRAVLMAHPDKGGTASAYLAVTAAYNVVRFHHKKEWDKDDCGNDDDARLFDEAESHPLLSALMIMILYIIVEATGKAPTLEVLLPVTIEDLYNARVKKLTLHVWRRRRPRCLSTTITDVDGLDGLAMDDGDLRLSRVTVMVPITVHVCREGAYVFEGVGHDCTLFDVAPHSTLPPGRGDVLIRIALQRHPVYEVDDIIDMHDVHAHVQVSIRDYYYGRKVVLPSLADGDAPSQPLEIEYLGANEESRVRVFKGRGLPILGPEGPEGPEGLKGLKGNNDDLTTTKNQREMRRGNIYVFFKLELPQIPQETLAKLHVRMFFEMLFGGLYR
jgi:DnaJ C terminal domain